MWKKPPPPERNIDNAPDASKSFRFFWSLGARKARKKCRQPTHLWDYLLIIRLAFFSSLFHFRATRYITLKRTPSTWCRSRCSIRRGSVRRRRCWSWPTRAVSGGVLFTLFEVMQPDLQLVLWSYFLKAKKNTLFLTWHCTLTTNDNAEATDRTALQNCDSKSDISCALIWDQ